MTKYDKNGKYVHDWIVTSTPTSEDWGLIPLSERHKMIGDNALTSQSSYKVINLKDLCGMVNEEYTLEVCNMLAYILDGRGDI